MENGGLRKRLETQRKEPANIQIQYLRRFGSQCLSKVEDISRKFNNFQDIMNEPMEIFLPKIRTIINSYELIAYQIYDSFETCGCNDLGQSILKMNVIMHSMIKWVLSGASKKRRSNLVTQRKQSKQTQADEQKNKTNIQFRDREIQLFKIKSLMKNVDDELLIEDKEIQKMAIENNPKQDYRKFKEQMINTNTSDARILLTESLNFFTKKNEFLQRFIDSRDNFSHDTIYQDINGNQIKNSRALFRNSTTNTEQISNKLRIICKKFLKDMQIQQRSRLVQNNTQTENENNLLDQVKVSKLDNNQLNNLKKQLLKQQQINKKMNLQTVNLMEKYKKVSRQSLILRSSISFEKITNELFDINQRKNSENDNLRNSKSNSQQMLNIKAPEVIDEDFDFQDLKVHEDNNEIRSFKKKQGTNRSSNSSKIGMFKKKYTDFITEDRNKNSTTKQSENITQKNQNSRFKMINIQSKKNNGSISQGKDRMKRDHIILKELKYHKNIYEVKISNKNNQTIKKFQNLTHNKVIEISINEYQGTQLYLVSQRSKLQKINSFQVLEFDNTENKLFSKSQKQLLMKGSNQKKQGLQEHLPSPRARKGRKKRNSSSKYQMQRQISIIYAEDNYPSQSLQLNIFNSPKLLHAANQNEKNEQRGKKSMLSKRTQQKIGILKQNIKTKDYRIQQQKLKSSQENLEYCKKLLQLEKQNNESGFQNQGRDNQSNSCVINFQYLAKNSDNLLEIVYCKIQNAKNMEIMELNQVYGQKTIKNKNHNRNIRDRATGSKMSSIDIVNLAKQTSPNLDTLGAKMIMKNLQKKNKEKPLEYQDWLLFLRYPYSSVVRKNHKNWKLHVSSLRNQQIQYQQENQLGKVLKRIISLHNKCVDQCCFDDHSSPVFCVHLGIFFAFFQIPIKMNQNLVIE